MLGFGPTQSSEMTKVTFPISENFIEAAEAWAQVRISVVCLRISIALRCCSVANKKPASKREGCPQQQSCICTRRALGTGFTASLTDCPFISSVDPLAFTHRNLPRVAIRQTFSHKSLLSAACCYFVPMFLLRLLVWIGRPTLNLMRELS